MNTFDLYTDGSCKGRWGSWAYLVAQNGKVLCEASGRMRKTDSNRMEFQAAIEGLLSLPTGSSVILHSDSRVLIDNSPLFSEWAHQRWKKKNGNSVPNTDLLKQVFDLMGSRQVTWKWVKAHSGNVLNERCDQLCISARQGDFGIRGCRDLGALA